MSSNDPEDLSKATIDLTKSSSSEVISVDQPSQTPPNSAICSPKSGTDNRKSPGDGSASKNRRKRQPKKVSTSLNDTSISDNEAMDIDVELTNKVSNETVISLSSEISKPESDCETIEKIAKMVSNITNEEKPPENESNVQTQDDNIIKEVENRLEEMFADVPETNVKEQSTLVPIAPEEIAKDSPKPVKPKATKRKKPDPGANKKQKKAVNGNKAKDKKNDKSGKSKGNDKNKLDIKDPKKAQKSKESNGKSKVKVDAAPYIQIQKDGSFTVVNQTLNGDDDTDKPSSKTKKPVTIEKHRQHIRGLHVSTLSNKYDADKRDTTWICVFCKLGPHKNKLGDLFGPYIISKTSEEYSLCLEDPANDIFRQSNKDKFIPIKSPVNTAKKKKKTEVNVKKLTSPTTVNVPTEEVFTGMTAVDENNYEIWFHEDCIVWSPGTHIIGTKIIGLEAAVWQSTRHRCEYCQKNGAMIACLTRGCSKEAHIVCAIKSWKLCEDFKTYCDLHST